MSFTIAFDNFRTEVQAVTGFSSKIEIPNPYDIESNATTFLRDSYGIRVGSSNDFAAHFNTTNDQNDFAVLLSKEVPKLNSNPSIIQDAIKSMKDESVEVRKHLLECNITGISQLTYSSTDAFEFYDGCIYTAVNFNVVVSHEIAPC